MASEVFTAREGSIRTANAVDGRTKKSAGVAIDARVGRDMSNVQRDELYEKLGKSFAQPVYGYMADEYKEQTGKSLPKDAVQIVFGRGAANGEDFRSVISQPNYSHLKTHEATLNRENMTFMSGYKSLKELHDFIDDVKSHQRRNKIERLERSWNRRKGTFGGF